MEQTPDRRSLALAARQLGVVTRGDLRACGLTDDQIDDRLSLGRYRTLARGVLVVAGTPITWQQYAYAACRAGPSGTVTSHLTAAAVLKAGDPPTLPHVTTPPGRSARMRIARVHRSALDRVDVTVVGVLPCTAPARTLVDCAGVLASEALAALVDNMLCRGLATTASVEAAMSRASRRPGRTGLPLLASLLEVWTPGPRPGSQAEMRLIRRLVDWGFPMPERQVEVRGPRRFRAFIDVGWPDQRIGIEYDGGEAHTPRDKPHDIARQRQLEALGWTIERARKRDIAPGASALRHRLAQAFDARAA
jgi:hypothetical protein